MNKALKLVREKITGTRKGCEESAHEHSIRVSDILKKYDYAQDVITAGLLHDIIEDGGMTSKELSKIGYSERIVSLVDVCTHDSTLRNKDARWTKMISRLIDANDKDAWSIKLADLLDNCRSCHTLPKERQAFIRTVKAPLILSITKDIFGQVGIWEELAQEINKENYEKI